MLYSYGSLWTSLLSISRRCALVDSGRFGIFFSHSFAIALGLFSWFLLFALISMVCAWIVGLFPDSSMLFWLLHRLSRFYRCLDVSVSILWWFWGSGFLLLLRRCCQRILLLLLVLIIFVDWLLLWLPLDCRSIITMIFVHCSLLCPLNSLSIICPFHPSTETHKSRLMPIAKFNDWSNEWTKITSILFMSCLIIWQKMYILLINELFWSKTFSQNAVMNEIWQSWYIVNSKIAQMRVEFDYDIKWDVRFSMIVLRVSFIFHSLLVIYESWLIFISWIAKTKSLND